MEDSGVVDSAVVVDSGVMLFHSVLMVVDSAGVEDSSAVGVDWVDVDSVVDSVIVVAVAVAKLIYHSCKSQRKGNHLEL